MTCDYPEITPICTGPTRDGAVLDILMENFNNTLVDQETLDPIRCKDGIDLDPMIVHAKFRMPRVAYPPTAYRSIPTII